MFGMELDGDQVDGAKSTPSASTEKVEKPKNRCEKRMTRQQMYSSKYKVKSWSNESRQTLLRNICVDLLLNKRGVFIKSSRPEDYINKCKNEAPKGVINSVLASRLRYNRQKKEKRRRKQKQLEAKAARRANLMKRNERRGSTLNKVSGKTKTSQPIANERLDLLLAKIQLNS